MLNHIIGFHPSLTGLLLRLALGVIFVAHGYPKLFKKEAGPKGTAAFLSSVGIPAALFFAYVVGIVEFFGGILLILGLFTRAVGIAIAINMLVAMARVKFKTGLTAKVMEGGWVGGFELDLALFTMALVLALFGAGNFSIDVAVFNQW